MRVLSLTHGPSVPGGLFDEVALEEGHRLERWPAPTGPPPEPPDAYDAIMVFGGAMHPDQDAEHAWLVPETAFLREAVSSGVPVLGVCLGSQLLARATGGRVGPAREPEIGWFEVELTEDGRADPVLGALPPRFEAFQWHRYAFSVPEGGVELARSRVCPQAFRIGRAWGVQFHPEVTLPMVETWVEEDPEELPAPVDRFRREARERMARWNEQGRALARAFLAAAAG